MSNNYNSRKMIPRGVDSSSTTTFSEQEVIRAASAPSSGHVVMTDGPCTSPPVVRQHRPVTGRNSNGNGPRLPQRRYPSVSTSPTRRVDGSSSPLLMSGGGRRSPSANTTRRAPERSDSGLGLDIVEESRPVIVAAQPPTRRPRFLGRCVPDSDDEVETDRGTSSVVSHHSSKVASTATPFYPSKSAPEVTSNYSTNIVTPSYTQQRPTEMMDTTNNTPSPFSYPSSLNSFDFESYQKHLLEIQHKAIEQDRLQQGLYLLLPNNDGDTGLHQAIIHSQPIMVSRLLELIHKYPQLKSCLDDQNSLYQTPLHLALHLQQCEVIGQLLIAGASPFLQDHKGNTPFHVACSFPNSKSLNELLRHMTQADIVRAANVRNYQGQTCLHSAVVSKNKEALLTLTKAGVPIDLQDHHSGKTPLHLATELGTFEIVQFLVKSCHADFNATTFFGCTPLHIAAGYNRLELVAYLISLGANPFALTDEGDIPLDLASQDNIRIFLSNMTEMYYS